MTSLVVSVALIVSFALLLTIHCSLAMGLLRVVTPRWYAVLLLLPPTAWLAPYWGFKHGFSSRSAAWLLCFCGYVLCLALAQGTGP